MKDNYKIYGGYHGKLKVYGWMETAGSDLWKHFPDARRPGNGNTQVRIVVAAESQKQVMEITGSRRSQLWNLSETGNVIEAGVTLNEPGVVFWRPNDGYGVPYRKRPAAAR